MGLQHGNSRHHNFQSLSILKVGEASSPTSENPNSGTAGCSPEGWQKDRLGRKTPRPQEAHYYSGAIILISRAAGGGVEDQAGNPSLDKWLLFTHSWQTSSTQSAANHPLKQHKWPSDQAQGPFVLQCTPPYSPHEPP